MFHHFPQFKPRFYTRPSSFSHKPFSCESCQLWHYKYDLFNTETRSMLHLHSVSFYIAIKTMKFFHFFCNFFCNGDDKNKQKSSGRNSSRSLNSDGEVKQRSQSKLDSQIQSKPKGVNKDQSSSDRLNSLVIFSYSEVRMMTKNFSLSTKLGEGGFGCVYKGTTRNPDDPSTKIEVAVKQLGKTGSQGHKEWLNEVNLLGFIKHPNLVKLIGYSAEDDERGIQRLLVYEYMQNKSVADHLSSKSPETLSWDMRLRIASDAARGLVYLHEEMDFQIIFRDFKSSNILLDQHWNCKLSDFGLARLGPEEGLSHVSTAVVGTRGYAAPEYLQTGKLTAKNDVWSFGVFLYELITGRLPLDLKLPKKEQKLLEWIKPYISNEKKFSNIIDPRLVHGKNVLKSAYSLSIIANHCLAKNPKSRPNMSQVLTMVNEVAEAKLSNQPNTNNKERIRTTRRAHRVRGNTKATEAVRRV